MAEDIKQQMLVAIEEAIENVHKRASEPYDGVVGNLPECVPRESKIHRMFARCIIELLYAYDRSEAKTFIDNYLGYLDEGYTWEGAWPLDYQYEVQYLATLWKAIGVGERDGWQAALEILTGSSLFQHICSESIHQDRSQRGKKNKGKPKYNVYLQKIITSIYKKIDNGIGGVTHKCVVEWFEEHYRSPNPRAGNKGCNDIYIDDQILYWVDEFEKDKQLAARSLEPYVKRAKETLALPE